MTESPPSSKSIAIQGLPVLPVLGRAVEADIMRQLVDEKMNPRHRPLGVDPLDGLLEPRAEVAAAKKLQEGKLGMGIGDDGGGFQLLAGGQPDAGDAAALEDDLADRCIDPDMDAARLRCPGQRLGVFSNSPVA